MTLADEANEKPVTLAMPASLPECSRIRTMSRIETITWTVTRTALSTSVLLDLEYAGAYKHTIVACAAEGNN